jgi:hypothetical protein
MVRKVATLKVNVILLVKYKIISDLKKILSSQYVIVLIGRIITMILSTWALVKHTT